MAAKPRSTQRRWDEAIDGYRKVLKVNVKNGPVCRNLGTAWRPRGSFEQALKYYQQPSNWTPRTSNALELRLAMACLRLGRIPEAVDAWRRRHASRPADPLIHYNSAEALFQHGQVARPWWRGEGNRLAPGNAALLNKMARHLVQQGQALSQQGRVARPWSSGGRRAVRSRPTLRR